MEKWMQIDGYEGKYYVSNTGLVMNDRGNLLKPSVNRGYLQVGLKKLNVVKCARVHRLVAFAFISNILNKDSVNHKNGIKSDNRVENLEWVTHQENKTHAVLHGLVGRHEKHGNAKLKNAEVISIRKKLSSGESCPTIAKEYGVSVSTIGRIRSNQLWKNISHI